MKKKTELQTVAGKTRRTGPLKEKTQVTVRLDNDLMQNVAALIHDDNMRLTDIIEEGLQLALAKRRHQLPAWTKQIRFVLANATTKQTEIIRGLAIAMVEAEVQAQRHAAEDMLWEIAETFLKSRNALPHAGKCLELYSRYGKSADEIAKLG